MSANELSRSALWRQAARVLRVLMSIVGLDGGAVKCHGCGKEIEPDGSWVRWKLRGVPSEDESWLWHWPCLRRSLGLPPMAESGVQTRTDLAVPARTPVGAELN